MNWIQSHILVSFDQFLIIALIIFIAFILFGMAGFGTALIASPLLAIYIPVVNIIPMLAIMDFIGACFNFMRDRKDVRFSEIKRLVPLMIIGSVGGVMLLVNLHPKILMISLSTFAITYSLFSLLKPKLHIKLNAWYSIPFGLIGGVFSSLFGSGGFLYSIYITSRVTTVNQIRATLSALLSFSTSTRTILFLLIGIYSDLTIVTTAALLLIPMMAGIFIGRHISLKLTHLQFKRVLSLITLGSGLTLMINLFL